MIDFKPYRSMAREIRLALFVFIPSCSEFDVSSGCRGRAMISPNGCFLQSWLQAHRSRILGLAGQYLVARVPYCGKLPEALPAPRFGQTNGLDLRRSFATPVG